MLESVSIEFGIPVAYDEYLSDQGDYGFQKKKFLVKEWNVYNVTLADHLNENSQFQLSTDTPER